AERYAPMNARSDIKASAQYMAEDLAFDGRAALKDAHVPILEISPYYAPDFSQPPMVMSEAQKSAYYASLLKNAPDAKVVSISPSRHFVMLDQPAKFQHALDGFLARVGASR
ncbi:MAG: alpha/beta hydrolase, partial [Rhodanobacter sp.]